MPTPIEFVDEQWVKWNSKPSNTRPDIHIDTEELKNILISDLTFASSMSVKEYTLYQKWLEIQERYPTTVVDTIFFDKELHMDFPEQMELIRLTEKIADRSIE